MTATARLAGDDAELAAAKRLRHEVCAPGDGAGPIDAGDHAVVVADTGVVVATGRLLDRGFVGVIDGIAIAPGVRGRGYGRAVLRVLEARAERRGLPAAELRVPRAKAASCSGSGYQVPDGPPAGEGAGHVTVRKDLLPGLRPARDVDAGAVEELIGQAWAEYPGVVLDVDREEPWIRAPAAAFAVRHGALWVVPGQAGLGGRLDACAGVRPGPAGEVAELKSLYVAARARRRGYGARLVWLVERWARDRGVTRVHLWSDARFTDAHRLYERLGYARTGGSRDLHDLSQTTELEFVSCLGPWGEPPAEPVPDTRG